MNVLGFKIGEEDIISEITLCDKENKIYMTNPVTFTFVPVDSTMLLSVDKYLKHLPFNQKALIKDKKIISVYKPSVDIIEYYISSLSNLAEAEDSILEYFKSLQSYNSNKKYH